MKRATRTSCVKHCSLIFLRNNRSYIS
uniref:Uncharacterized protein n=1 Tax=Rhizophora mucronata TaxID=61149 RepID=A0A2P2MY88_RHIMU